MYNALLETVMTLGTVLPICLLVVLCFGYIRCDSITGSKFSVPLKSLEQLGPMLVFFMIQILYVFQLRRQMRPTESL